MEVYQSGLLRGVGDGEMSHNFQQTRKVVVANLRKLRKKNIILRKELKQCGICRGFFPTRQQKGNPQGQERLKANLGTS